MDKCAGTSRGSNRRGIDPSFHQYLTLQPNANTIASEEMALVQGSKFIKCLIQRLVGLDERVMTKQEQQLLTAIESYSTMTDIDKLSERVNAELTWYNKTWRYFSRPPVAMDDADTKQMLVVHNPHYLTAWEWAWTAMVALVSAYIGRRVECISKFTPHAKVVCSQGYGVLLYCKGLRHRACVRRWSVCVNRFFGASLARRASSCSCSRSSSDELMLKKSSSEDHASVTVSV
jgi:hypothetical protein